jgi:predicted nucleic acid-binding protein
MARRRAASAPQRLILDAGAVIALSRREHRALAFLRRAVELDAEVRVPVAVVAETVRSTRRDAPVHRVLTAVGLVEPTSEPIGRRAGALLGRTGGTNTIDALVVAEAIESGGANILTGDPHDLALLAQGEANVSIHPLTQL